jgi:hypothetical protein
MEKQELELLESWRRLCPADRNTILTAVTMAVTAEEAVRQLLKTPHCAEGDEPQGGGKPAA